jgi:hypothetical protein
MSTVAPLAYTLRILQLAAPVFLCAFPPPYPPHLPDILLTIRDDIILEHFAVSDVVTSIMTGRPLLCQLVAISFSERNIESLMDYCP